MPNTPTDRHRSRIAVAAVSGATAIAAFSATGWLAGAAARTAAESDQAQTDQAQADQAQGGSLSSATGVRVASRADRHRPVVLKQRPQRTHVTVRYVQGTPSAPVGGGGTVSVPTVHTPAAPNPQPATHPAPQPAPQPAPAPPPAPSSGS